MTDSDVEKPRLTIPHLAILKAEGKKVVMASVYDYLTAQWAEQGGVDIAAVGDSLGMIAYGHANTLPMTVDQMVLHTQAVKRGAPKTMVITAMPYGSYATPELAVLNALRLMKEGGADAVKMQGGREKFDTIKAVADAGIPVMSHVGMCPHFVHQYGGFLLQGRTAAEAMEIIDNARAIEEAGAIGLEIEAVPRNVGKAVDDAVSIFTFAIGAGSAACGQLLMGADLMGCFTDFKPKFAKRYGAVADHAVAAFKAYVADVHGGTFPDEQHSYGTKAKEAERLEEILTGD